MEQIGIVAQLGGGSVVTDAAALEHVGRGREGERDVRELLDQQNPDARLGDRRQRRYQSLHDHGREPERQLVDEQDRRT